MSDLIERLRKQAERGTYIPDGPKLIMEALSAIEGTEILRRATTGALELRAVEVDELKARNAQLTAALREIAAYGSGAHTTVKIARAALASQSAKGAEHG